MANEYRDIERHRLVETEAVRIVQPAGRSDCEPYPCEYNIVATGQCRGQIDRRRLPALRQIVNGVWEGVEPDGQRAQSVRAENSCDSDMVPVSMAAVSVTNLKVDPGT
jgi:hypothetical protein